MTVSILEILVKKHGKLSSFFNLEGVYFKVEGIALLELKLQNLNIEMKI